jgi:hypothetical protein
MCRSLPLQVGLLVCVCLAAGHAPEAAAQFGKLKKAAEKQAAGSAANVATGAATEAATGGSCVPLDRPPIQVDAVPLTAAQMAKVNAGLDAEIAAAAGAKQEADRQQKQAEQDQKAYEKAQTDYDKRKQAYDACSAKITEEAGAKSEALNKKAEASQGNVLGGVTQEQIEEQGKKAQAAAQRISEGKGTAEDRKTLADFQAMMAKVQSGSAQMMAVSQESSALNAETAKRIETECGKEPVAPVAPSSAGGAADVISSAGAKAAGVDASTWRQWREDMIALAMSNTVVKPGKVSQADADAMNQSIKDTGKKICDLKKAGVPI